MIKLLVLGVIFYVVYKFWAGPAQLQQESSDKEEEYTDYEEVD